MNTESIQAQQDAFMRQMNSAALVGAGMLLVYVAVLAAYFLLVAFTAVHCASKGPEKNNASWMMLVIFVPIGWILYWFCAPRSDELSFQKSDGVFPPSVPFKPSSMSIADSVNAAVAEDVRKKRERIYPK